MVSSSGVTLIKDKNSHKLQTEQLQMAHIYGQSMFGLKQ